MSVQQQDLRNLIIRSLDAEDFAAIAPHLEPVNLAMREPVVEANQPITHAWFFETAVASLVVTSASGRQAEVGLAGHEGMVDVAPVNGIDMSPLDAFAQIPGFAHRVSIAVLQDVMAAQPSLRAALLRYTQTVVVQFSSTALVNVSHTLEQRLARWLLMTHDRIEGDEIPMTHQFLSLMLGVRRAGVTIAVHKLESVSAIRARRGLMIVTDRAGLEAIAGDAYGLPEAEYARLIGTDFRRTLKTSTATELGPRDGYSSMASRA